jgi:DNA-binding CsgD family transcriptional regulator
VALSERQSELLLFDRVSAAAVRGRGAVVLVSGPVGTGKTSLLREAAARAKQHGGRRFLVTARAGGRRRPFGVLDRLIRSMGANRRTEPFPDARPRRDDDLFTTMERIGTALIGIDDAHFIDDQSLAGLCYAIRRIEGSGIVVVLTESSSHEPETADLRAEILHLPYCHRVRIAPLTPAGVTEQLTRRLGAASDDELARLGTETAGGNPLLLQTLIDDRTAAAPTSTGAGFQRAVLRILHRCRPVTAVVAQAMAVLADHATPALVAELSGADVSAAAAGMRDLHETGLLAAGRFRHGPIRAAVLASIPGSARPARHRRAAELLHASGAPALAVAEHLITARDGGRATWRTAILYEAAREAMAAGDLGTAMKSLRYAGAASSDESQRAHTAVLAAEAQWLADPRRAARRLQALLRDARSELLSGPDMLAVVEHLLWRGEFREADELMARAGPAGGASSLAQLWSLFRGTGYGSGRLAGPLLTRSGTMAAAVYLGSAATLASDATTVDHADQILLSVRAGTPHTPALHALVVLVRTGRLDEAAAWCDRLMTVDRIARVPLRRAIIGTIRAVAALRGGDSTTASNGIREVLALVPPPAWGVVAGLPLSVALRAATDVGDARSVASYLAAPVPPSMVDTPFMLPYLFALGRSHLARGHLGSALPSLRSCAELSVKWGVDPASIDGYDDAVAAATASGPPAPVDDPRLTDAEQRVAALAVAGRTNREIAEILSVTVSTVEEHLTRIYRKLAVRSRSGLRQLRH